MTSRSNVGRLLRSAVLAEVGVKWLPDCCGDQSYMIKVFQEKTM